MKILQSINLHVTYLVSIENSVGYFVSVLSSLQELIVPLLTLIEAGYKDKEMKEIGSKAQNIYNHLLALKKVRS